MLGVSVEIFMTLRFKSLEGFPVEWTVTWNIKKNRSLLLAICHKMAQFTHLSDISFLNQKTRFFFQVISTALMDLDPES